LSADVGYNEVILEDKADGLLVHLDATRQIGPGGKITFGVGQEFSSAGDVFQLGQAAGGVQLESSDVIGTADPFERRYLNIGYDFQRNRTSLGFEARLSRERYETFTELDRDVSSYRVYVGRQVSPVIGIRLFANLEKEEFVEQAFDDDELGYGASLDWQVGRRMSLRLQYDHYDRDSSNAASDYTEGQASLFIVWSPIQQQR